MIVGIVLLLVAICFAFFLWMPTKEASINVARSENLEEFKGGGKETSSNELEDIDDIFIGFVGNNQAVESLKRLIKYAKINGFKKLPNIGLFGPRSTGKTELQRRIAQAMGIPVLILSKSTINNEETFFKQVSKEIEGYAGGNLIAPPMIIFIDEVHLLSRRLQDSLLTALESDDRCFRTKHGDIDTTNITFIVATTDPGKLSPAFLSRLTVFVLKSYTNQEIVKMLQSRMMSDNSIDECALMLEDRSLEFIAEVSRLIPRRAIEILRQASYAIAAGVIHTGHEEVVGDIKKLLECDDNGMTKDDLKYLDFLNTNGSSGLNTLSAYLDTDKDNVESFIEPWLLQKGLIAKGARGRSITHKGKEFLKGMTYND